MDILAALAESIREDRPSWRLAILCAIAAWPLAGETANGVKYEYLVGGEAFDWRLLASRLVRSLNDRTLLRELEDWLLDPDPEGGLPEAEFTRAIGGEKHRSHLNYLYGVTVEKALLTAVEEEITKRRVASGTSASERARDEAYERLYESTVEALWSEFKIEDGRKDRGKHGPDRNHLSLADLDAFTYWLFKRRMRLLDPARIASDTRKGLLQLERMRIAHERRLAEQHFRSVVGDWGKDEAEPGRPNRVYRRPIRRY